jgi:hypothetical protein
MFENRNNRKMRLLIINVLGYFDLSGNLNGKLASPLFSQKYNVKYIDVPPENAGELQLYLPYIRYDSVNDYLIMTGFVKLWKNADL